MSAPSSLSVPAPAAGPAPAEPAPVCAAPVAPLALASGALALHGAGPRLIVTRPAEQAAPWVKALRARGIDAVALPLIDIAPGPDPAAVRQAWFGLADAAFAMFVSINAVHHFFALRPSGMAWPSMLEAGCTGPGTARALRAALDAAGAAGAPVLQPGPDQALESESLWRQIAARDWRAQRVLVVRGEQGRDWLADQWHATGARVDFVAAYRRMPAVFDAAGRALLQTARQVPQRHVWHFSSAEALAHLSALAPLDESAATTVLVTHPRIAEAARVAGFLRVRLIDAGLEGVLKAMVDLKSTFP